MKAITYILIIFVFGLSNSLGQSVDKNYVDNWILKTFPNSIVDRDVLYVLNGILIEDNELNTKLSKYKPEDLTTINFVDKSTIDKLTFGKPLNGIIIMISKGQQSRKSIKSDLEIVKGEFKQPEIKTTADIDSKNAEPVLIINGKHFFFQDCFNEINKLKSKDLYGINIINKPVSKEIYGANADNGLIIITKKR